MMKPSSREAYKLLHDGSVVLSQVEANGMRVDVDYLHRAIDSTDRKIRNLTTKLKRHKIYDRWRRRFGSKTKIGSREQLGKVLFEELGYECSEKTKTGKYQVTEASLANIDSKFVKAFLRVESLKKMRTTYLGGIRRELVGDRINPVFNLHTVVTFRSSCDSPNLQNMPIRDPEQGELIRKCFIPSKNHVLVEVDYGAIEVRVAAAYHKDPNMLSYIEDPERDMHRDMAAQCYKVETDQVTKAMRHCGKNMFVFPQFYGDYFVGCSQNLWNAIDRSGFEVGGIPLKDHLKKKGIRELGSKESHWETGRIETQSGTFMEHIRQVEKDFWERRFAQYGNWKKEWWAKYLKRGWLDMLTGFTIHGLYGRNDVINYPVQGAAFHCLLWSLIRIQWKLNKYKMKSKLVGQIHDSIIGDVYKPELKDYLEIVKTVMTEDIRRYWKWIITTLEIEAEVSDKTWFDKEAIEI